MASALPCFENFDVHGDGDVAQRWDRWINKLQNLFIAANIKDSKRLRARF